MNRRRWIGATGGMIGSLTLSIELGRSRGSARALKGQTPVPVQPVEAAGATLAAGEEVELREGVGVRFLEVTRDNRCPADLQCYVAGSAD